MFSTFSTRSQIPSRTPTPSRARARGLSEGFSVTRVTWSRRVLRSRMRLRIDQGGVILGPPCREHPASVIVTASDGKQELVIGSQTALDGEGKVVGKGDMRAQIE